MSRIQIEHAINSWNNTIFIGPPGTGKTSAVFRAIDDLRGRLAPNGRVPLALMMSGAQVDRPDITGMPAVARANTDRLPPQLVEKYERGVTVRMLPEEMLLLAQYDVVPIFVIDEFQHLATDVATSLLTLIANGRGTSLSLPCPPLAIGIMNPPAYSSGARVPPNLAARFKLIDWEVDVKEWVEGFPGNWGEPLDVRGAIYDVQTYIQARSVVASFIKGHPHLLVKEPEDPRALAQFPNPRNWEGVSRDVALGLHYGYSPEQMADLDGHFAGWVGKTAAQAMATYLAGNMVDPSMLLGNPDEVRQYLGNPVRAANVVSQVTAYLSALEALGVTEAERKRLVAAGWTIADMVRNSHKELGLAMALQLYSQGLVDHRQVNSWAEQLKVAKARMQTKAV